VLDATHELPAIDSTDLDLGWDTRDVFETDDAIVYEVFSECTGLVYLGTDEEAADAAWDKWVDYIDNDAALEPIYLRYLVNGVLFYAYRSITSN